MEVKLLVEAPDLRRSRRPDRSLLRLLGQARHYRNRLFESDGKAIGEPAEAEGVGSPWFRRILRLAFLAPDITETILDGRQPTELSAEKLTIGRRSTGRLGRAETGARIRVTPPHTAAPSHDIPYPASFGGVRRSCMCSEQAVEGECTVKSAKHGDQVDSTSQAPHYLTAVSPKDRERPQGRPRR
jgi:hypothetical protein